LVYVISEQRLYTVLNNVATPLINSSEDKEEEDKNNEESKE